MKNTKVQTLGELRMRDIAKLMGWAICTRSLPLVAPESLTRASYSSRYIACGSRCMPFVVTS